MKIIRQACYKCRDTSDKRKKLDTIIVCTVKFERIGHPKLGEKLALLLKQKQLIIGRGRLFSLLR